MNVGALYSAITTAIICEGTPMNCSAERMAVKVTESKALDQSRNRAWKEEVCLS